MDWESKSLDWTDYSLGRYHYKQRETTVATKLAANEVGWRFQTLLK
jgi:hypothetical protein